MSYKKFEKDLEKKLKVVAVNGKSIKPTSVDTAPPDWEKYIPQHVRLPRRLPKNVPELGVLERSIATITSPFIELSRGALDIGEGLLDETLGNILIGGSKAVDKIAGTDLSDDAEKLVAKKFVDDYFDSMTLLKDRYRYDNAVTNTVDEVGNVLGNVAAQYILGLPGAAIGYGGQKLEDKLNEGSSYGKAVASSVGTIGAQIAADKILGGVIKGKNIDNRTFASPVLATLFKNGGDDAVKATGKQMLKNVLKGTKNQIVVAGKEWGEETLENVLDTLIDNVIYGENEALLPSLEEFLQTGKISALTTIILGAGGDYVNRNYANKIKQDIDTIRSSDEYINGDADTKAALDTEINNMIKDYQSRFNENEVDEDDTKKGDTKQGVTKKSYIKKGDIKKDNIYNQTSEKLSSEKLGGELNLSSSVEDLLARKNKLTDLISGSTKLLGSIDAFYNKKELATSTEKAKNELKAIEEELKKRSVIEQEQVIDTELDSVASEMREDLNKGITSNTLEQETVLNNIIERASELDKDSKVKFNTNKAKVLQNKKKNLADATKLVNDLNYLLTGENYGKVRIAPPDTAAHKMATELGALFGKQVVFVSSPFDLSGMKMEGNDDLLILNHDNNVMSTAVDKESGEKISVNTNLAYTVLHETFHTMKSDTDTNLYNDFMDYIRNTTSDEQLNEYVMYRYGKDSELANQMMANKDNLIEEIGADEFAKLLTDQKTLKKLRVNDESLFNRVIDYIKNMIDAVSQTYFKSPLTKAQVDSLRKILDANLNNTEIDVMKEVEKTIGYNPIEMKELEEGISKLEADEQRKKEKLQRQEEKELKKLDRDIKKLEKAEKNNKKAKTSNKKGLPSKSNKEVITMTNTGAILKEEYQQEQIRKAKEEGYRQGFKDAGGTPQNTREQSANRTTPKFKEVYAEGTFRNLKGKLTEFRDKLENNGVLNDKDKVRVTELVRQVNESKLDLSDDQINAFIRLSDYVAKPTVKKSKTETTKVNKKEDTTKDIVHPFALNEEPVETVTITSSESENTPKVETIEKTPSKKKETTKKETKKKVVDEVVPKTEIQEVVKAIPKEERPFASDIIVAKVDNPKTVDDVEVVSPSDITVEETITDTPTEEVTQVNEETQSKAKLEAMKYELEKSFGKGDQQKNIDKYLEYKKLGGKELPKFEYLLNKPKEVEQAYSSTIPESLSKPKLPTKSETKVEKTVEQPTKTEQDTKAETEKQVNFLRTKVTDLDTKISADKKLNRYIPTMLNMYDRYLSLGGEKLPQIEAYKNTELNNVVNDMIKADAKKEVSKVEEAPKVTKEDTIKPKLATKETKTDKLPTKKLEKKTEDTTKLNKTQMLKKVRDDLAWYQYNLDENYLTNAINQYKEYKNAGGKTKIAELDEILEQRKSDKIVDDFDDGEITGPSDEELRRLEAKLVVKKTPDLPKAPEKSKPVGDSKDDFRAKMAQMGFKFDVGTKDDGKYLSKVFANINEKTDPRFVEIVKKVEQVDSKLGRISRESNADAKERALENLQKNGVSEEYGRLTAQKNGKYTNISSTEDEFELAVMAEMYKQRGEESKALNCMAALQETATNGARFVQAMSAIKYSSPELYTLSLVNELSRYYKKTVDTHIKDPMVKAWISEVEKKGGVENLLSPEEYMVMESLVTEAFKIDDTNSDEYKQRIALANKIVADKMPRKYGEQLMNTRKLSMLLNTTTLIKNVITPAIGHPVNLATTAVGSFYDKLVSDMTTYNGKKVDRTVANLTMEDRKNIQPFINKEVKRAILENKLGITTQDGANIDYQRDIFNSNNVVGRVGNRIGKALYGAMSIPDEAFHARYFEGYLQSVMRANNVTEPTAEMIANATKEANARTYKNKNSRIYRARKTIVNLMNKVDIDGFRLGDFLEPFLLVPSNLASLAAHYTPAGAIDAIHKGKKYKSMLDNDKVSKEDVLTAKYDFVQSMSQATVGSLMFVAAHVLAQAGLTTGDEDEDKETAEFMKAVGFKPYSFKVGGKYITYDWAQPYTTPLAIMSEYERLRNKDDLDMNIFDEFRQLSNVAVDSILNMTGYETLKTFLVGDGYGDDDWVERIFDTLVSLPQSYIPGIVKATADFIDPNQKQVYDDNPLKYAINQVIEGTPLLKSMLENKMNVLGEVPQLYAENPILRLADVYLNPAKVGSDRSKQYLSKELLDVYNHTGVDSILPTHVNSVISYKVDGKQMDVKLSRNQRNEIIGETGKILSNAISELLLNDSYVGLDYDEKAELLTVLGSYARGKAIADSGYAKGYAPTSGDYATINKYINSGLSTANALTYKQIINKIEGEKDANGETIQGTKQGNKAYAIMQMDISDDQKNAMLGLITTSKTPETVDSLSNLLTIDQYHSYFAMNKKDTFISEKISRADYVIASTMGIDTDTFLNYANDVSAITADYDANGNAIPNSKRNKIFNYINNLPGLNIAQKAYLLRNAGYSAKQYQGIVYNYINSLPISATEKNEIWQTMYGK